MSAMRALAFACLLGSLEALRSSTSGALELQDSSDPSMEAPGAAPAELLDPDSFESPGAAPAALPDPFQAPASEPEELPDEVKALMTIFEAPTGNSLVCSIEEVQQDVQYDIKFTAYFPGGCNEIKCGNKFFQVLSKMMVPHHEASGCTCFGGGIMSSTGETLPIFKFKSTANSCTAEECLSKYSKALYLAKKAENPDLEPEQAVANPEHWSLKCIDKEAAFGNPGVPSLVKVASDLNSKGGRYAEAVQDIIQQLDITSLDDADFLKSRIY
jgi:hypothetical protein